MMLADTTAWIWSRKRSYPDLRAWFDEQLEAGEIVTCDLVRLELLAGVHSSQYADRARDLAALDTCPIGSAELERALELQRSLADRRTDYHKRLPPSDLLIAAAAESAAVELLHYDKDFERIAEVSGQPLRRLAPTGTLE